MNTFTYGTISTSAYALTILAERGEAPEAGPPSLIATKAVQTRDGWLGQVIVDRDIVAETGPHEDGKEAQSAANQAVIDAFKRLFAEPGDNGA